MPDLYPLSSLQDHTLNLREKGIFCLVATPIGNLEDLSARARQVLAQADLILCEDTRVTARLLQHYGITTPTESLHDHNEAHRIPTHISRLHKGMTIALVSDAGTPVISDPGYRLVRAVIEAELPVTAIPGPNAALMALTLSGFPPHPFLFMGFPPTRQAARLSDFSILKAVEQAGLSTTVIWYEAPHRLAECLGDIAEVFGSQRPVAIARELTKRFEELRRGSAKELADFYAHTPPRGEIVLLMAPNSTPTVTTQAELDRHILHALTHMSLKDAAAFVAKTLNLPKKTVYTRALELAQNTPKTELP
ncbi:16S rRNA (cytidine(1402)-2'-O)-methyltransferase [Entomobacter blattae]|uniref:Ribosomal RNA small subunit methyltransferase I n=1 Tax=Entomobacter blattae TaxID=2762277 RepID=A0A7H1NQH5_9PROT|nr:16S rRNA (cytidine(1402)-2'-O)-methyltransferase [Entomobacter blattae]QNT78035.1 Ribosomal RNA small subunit methyltransferase I [Entomobacter blattae]